MQWKRSVARFHHFSHSSPHQPSHHFSSPPFDSASSPLSVCDQREAVIQSEVIQREACEKSLATAQFHFADLQAKAEAAYQRRLALLTAEVEQWKGRAEEVTRQLHPTVDTVKEKEQKGMEAMREEAKG